MPREFSMRLDGNYCDDFTCREEAAGHLRRKYTREQIREELAAGTTHVLALHMVTTVLSLHTIHAYLLEAIEEKIAAVQVRLNTDMWARTIVITLTGTIQNVYYAMWWASLIARLTSESTMHRSVGELISNSAEESDSWYRSNIFGDRERAVEAYRTRRDHKPIALFLTQRGPAQMLTALTEYKNDYSEIYRLYP
jgi:hypothetical protein